MNRAIAYAFAASLVFVNVGCDNGGHAPTGSGSPSGTTSNSADNPGSAATSPTPPYNGSNNGADTGSQSP